MADLERPVSGPGSGLSWPAPWQLPDPGSEAPAEWVCNVLWGGNRFVKQSFRTPGLEGCLLSIPHGGDPAGGDIYHITVCGHGVFSKFLLVDAMGHGREAALISQALLEPLERLATELDNRAVLAELNRVLRAQAAAGKFATAAAATFNAWDATWTYAYAGHPPMLIRRQGRWSPLENPGDRALPAGIVKGIEFRQCAVTLSSGDWLLLYSDALSDLMLAHAGDRDMFQALCALLDAIDTDHVETFHAALTGRLVEINGGALFGDDLTFMLLRHGPPGQDSAAGWRARILRPWRAGMMRLMKWRRRLGQLFSGRSP